jgi:hypothetical protein
METMDTLEELWDGLLSREPDRILVAFATLSSVEKESVLSHLRKMAEEPGWHPEQRNSAQAALAVLQA